jgi:pyruvate-formate lyase
MRTDGKIREEFNALEYGNLNSRQEIRSVEREMRFTEVHRSHADAHPYEREAACIAAQTEMILMPILEGDRFAGRIDRMAAGIDPERGGLTDAAYFCQFDRLQAALSGDSLDPQTLKDIRFLIDYWEREVTSTRCRAAFSVDIQQGLPSDDYYSGREIAYPMYGLGGPCLDYAKLVRLGIPGLRAEVRKWKAVQGGAEPHFYAALESALDTFEKALLASAAEAGAKSRSAPDEAGRECFRRIARSCRSLASNPPSGYHEAVQLIWLYSLAALPRNYGRLDAALGPFLCRDLDEGRISVEEAFDLTLGLWRLIEARGDNFNNRILIGGLGRPDPAAADRWALLALDVQEAAGGIIPQLSLRCHRGMNPDVLRRGLEVIRKGSTFPMLYNDDVNVPAAARAFGVRLEEAEQVIPYGCGEFVLDHASVGSPDAALNVLKALDVTLRNGVDGFFGEARGLALGRLSDYATFDDLQSAFQRQVEYHVGLLARVQAAVYRVTGETAAFPFLCLLYDDCVRRGKPMLAGGVRHLGGTLESFGNNSAADALFAIKRMVYDEKRMTPDRLLSALDTDFEGFERERRILLGVPKFGNDDPDADAMSLWVNRVVCGAAKEAGRRAGLDSFLVVLVNNGDSVLFGKTTAASADGRKRGEPLSNANQPSAGMDRNGLTALLNSMVKLDASWHAGAVQNLKLSRTFMDGHPREAEALIRGYFAAGGTQLMVTVTDPDELEKALADPEAYGHLIVRVGGYSEYFVKLPAEIRREVVRRTLY